MSERNKNQRVMKDLFGILLEDLREVGEKFKIGDPVSIKIKCNKTVEAEFVKATIKYTWDGELIKTVSTEEEQKDEKRNQS